MPDRLYLLFPLVSGLIYAVSAMALKPAMNSGLGPFRTAFITQAVISGSFAFLLFGVDGPLIPDPFWPSLLAGGIFSIGGLATIYVLKKGDVSIATPIMGSKVVMVAFLLVLLLNETLDPVIWVSAILTLVGIVVLNLRWGKAARSHHHLVFTVTLSIFASLCYALVDILFQYWCGHQGFYLFGAWSSICAGFFSLFLIPFFNGPVWKIPPGAGKFLAIGAVGMSLQAICMAIGVGYFSDAAGSNIAYSGRGVWTVLLVWWVGHWFNNTEKDVGPATMACRVIGALLISVAIVLLFL
jgi:drug/metabolite transporter (DMT)-like permease